MEKVNLRHGDEVLVPWGVDEVRGTVESVYGSTGHERVIILLTPELSGSVVDGSTTLTLPLASIQKARKSAVA